MILKFTPQLHFHLDEAIERGTKVMEIMRQIDEVAPPIDGGRRMDARMPSPSATSRRLTRFDEAEHEDRRRRAAAIRTRINPNTPQRGDVKAASRPSRRRQR